jgi:prepilin-type N-terminal cleavage/methylation domain-containing protein
MRRRVSVGMTLIELMIAIAIASTLAVAGYRALTTLTNSASALTSTAANWQELESALASIERAYRRAAPGGKSILEINSLTMDTLDANGQTQRLQFPPQTNAVRHWTFSAWNGQQWVPSWTLAGHPAGLKIALVTLAGDEVERIYAR